MARPSNYGVMALGCYAGVVNVWLHPGIQRADSDFVEPAADDRLVGTSLNHIDARLAERR
jgi:hypothetical protein